MAKQKYGSFKNAIKAAGINYSNFLSGFDIESSQYLNRMFSKTVITVLKDLGIILQEQSEITFNEAQYNILKIDQNRNWYIIKIIPWSNLTKYLVNKINDYNKGLITVIYFKKAEVLPQIDLIQFKNFEEYLENRFFEESIAKKIKIMKNMLNAKKIVIK